jgi:hypothetical protein
MTRQGAERAVTVSALIVFGVYFYRLASEGHSSSGGGLLQLGGVGAPANVGRFITGWGFAYLVLAIITEAAPPLGGSLAILVAAGDVLANAGQVAADVNTKLDAGVPPKGDVSTRDQGAGIPIYNPSRETKDAYDKRLGDWLRTHPQPSQRPASGAGVFGAPPIGGFPGSGR